MDEETMRVALDPKATGSFLLAKALEGVPLDFLVFFSSTNALQGNPGQANYVAGCASSRTPLLTTFVLNTASPPR